MRRRCRVRSCWSRSSRPVVGRSSSRIRRGRSRARTASCPPSWWRNQQRDYLDYAARPVLTRFVHEHDQQRRVGRVGTTRPFNTAGITLADYANSFQRMDNFVDTADFDLTYMMNLWYGYRDLLPADVRAAMEQPHAVVQVLVHRPAAGGHHRPALLLVREPPPALPRRRVPRRAGVPERRVQQRRQHRRLAQGAGAAAFIDEWLAEKARFGFTEWHSDVYYQKTADALLTLVEWVDDPALVQRARRWCSISLFFDIALHIQRGNFGATHGRSYMKDKSVATDQDTFNMSKLAVRRHAPRRTHRPTTRARRCSPAPSATALPAVILRVAQRSAPRSTRSTWASRSIRSRPSTRPRPASLGYSFTDPENVPFWWERGAQTAWQIVPLDARHARPVRPVGVGLLQAVQAHRRHHRRRPRRGADARAAARPDVRASRC